MFIDGYLVTSIDAISAYGTNGGAYRWTASELQKADIQNTQDNKQMTGKNGQVISVLKQNKACKITFTNGNLITGLIADETGGTVTSGETTIKYTDVLTVSSDKELTTSFVATGTVGNEIGEIYMVDKNVTVKTFTQNATASKSGEFAYEPTTRKITFFTGDVKEGDIFSVRYDMTVTDACTVSNTSDKVSATVELVLDCTVQTLGCHDEYYMQFKAPYVDCSGNFNITMGDQSVQDFEGTCLSSSCNGTKGSKFWDYVVYDLPDAE